MKKVIYVGAFLFLGSMALTSCKKDYTCECSADGMPTQTAPINDSKKDDAQDNCDKIKDTYSIAFPKVACDLKAK